VYAEAVIVTGMDEIRGHFKINIVWAELFDVLLVTFGWGSALQLLFLARGSQR